jgi:hypothetical protein
METNPDEFLTQEKWGHLIQSHKMFLSEEDRNALEDALNGLMQQRFTERVMTELLAPEEDDSLGKQWYTANATPTVGQTLATSLMGSSPVWSSPSLTLGNQTLDESTIEHMKAHIDAHNAVLKKQKKHKTLFGKLFNYQ